MSVFSLPQERALFFWNEFPGGEFNRNVLAISFPSLSSDIFARLIEESLKASLETEEGEVGSFSVAFEPPNPTSLALTISLNETLSSLQ